MGSSTTLTVRPAQALDAPELRRLVEPLGSAVEADEIGRRLREILESPDHQILVAHSTGDGVDLGQLLGWIHVFAAPRLTVATFAEIGGLAVDEAQQGQGIGRRLVAAAGAWARRRGLDTLRVRSRVERAGAHRFYRRLGFDTTKQQEVLELAVASD